MIYFDPKLTMNEITIACDTLACVLVPDTQGNMVVTPRAALEPVKPISANNRQWHVQCLDCGAWFESCPELVSSHHTECDYCGAIYSEGYHGMLHAMGKWIDPDNITNEGKIK
ncbi:MAG: hypothetical protein GY799_25295 [Desulfobulbaceae bacterium]|nr:hypothetical protein [Desulfobulbaceae bacterium]